MIIKGSQRGSGANLAVHLMRMDENEHVRLHEIRGFASDNLLDAFREAEAVSLGTKCRQYLFSVSINPPQSESVSVEVFEDTLDRIERQLGLEGQPRAVVFHEKENRHHAHAVWSRIDAETMTERHLPYFKNRLFNLARDLHLEHGWETPRGMIGKAERDPTNFSLAEWQQTKRQGIDPRWLKKSVQDCWASSDNSQSFQTSLQERGFILAKGARRGHVVIDHTGEVYALSRMLDVKTKDVRARLGDPEMLRSVENARKLVAERMTPTIRRHINEAKDQFHARSAKLGEFKAEMTKRHRLARDELASNHKREWDAETLARAKRLPKGLRGLWQRFTGKYQQVRALNEAEAEATLVRHAKEQSELIDRQRQSRAGLQTRFLELRHQHARQLNELRKDIGRFLGLGQGREPQTPNRRSAPSLRLTR